MTSLATPAGALLFVAGGLVGAGCSASVVEPQTPAHAPETLTDSDVEAEIVALHVFFEEWFRGELPQTEVAFARFGDALGDDFVIVSPTGHLSARDPILSAVYDAHGSWPEGNAIRIEAVDVRWRLGGTVLATYEEWQTRDGATTGRLSTVLMSTSSPPRWLHVHETWLPDNAPK